MRNRMSQQAATGNRPKLSEKGLLTPDNSVVALIDHQPQMLFGVATFDRQGVINNLVALAKAARFFDLPFLLTTVQTKTFTSNPCPLVPTHLPTKSPPHHTQ